MYVMLYWFCNGGRPAYVLFIHLTMSIGAQYHVLGSHYRSDHHRYNMKVCGHAIQKEGCRQTHCILQRRVAGLPPITAEVFNQKVLQRREETMVTTSPKGATCEVCKCVIYVSFVTL